MNPLILDQAADHRSAHTALSVNVNKVALLRNSRHLNIPSVVRAAQCCLQAGCQLQNSSPAANTSGPACQRALHQVPAAAAAAGSRQQQQACSLTYAPL